MSDNIPVIPPAAFCYRFPIPPNAPRSLLCHCGALALYRVAGHRMATNPDYRCEEHAAERLPPPDLVTETAAKCAEALARLYGQVGSDLSVLPKSQRTKQLMDLLLDATGALHDLSGQLTSSYVKMVLEEHPTGWPVVGSSARAEPGLHIVDGRR